MAAVVEEAPALALIWQTDALHRHLKEALAELGANVVYECHADRYDAAALDASGASVVVINLDPEGADAFDALGDLLLDETRRVIFNDGEVTSRLEGWDLARWTRHLAVKVMGAKDFNPPRPQGAEAIPVKVKSSVPPPSVVAGGASAASNGGFHLEGDAFAAAMSADTGVAMARERAALDRAPDAVRPDLIPRPSGNATYAVDPAELEMHLPDSLPADPPTLELPADELKPAATKREFPTLELAADELVAAAAKAASPTSADPPTLELPPLASLPDALDREAPTLEIDATSLGLARAAHEAPGLEADGFIEARDAGAEPVLDQTLDFSLDESLLSAIEAPFPSTSPIEETSVADDTFDPASFEMPELEHGGFATLATEEPATASPDPLSDALRDFGFLDEPPPAPQPEAVMDLDTLLLRAGEAEEERRKGSLGAPEAVFAPKPAAASAAPSAPASSAAPPEPAASKPDPARPLPKERTLADFESALASLSLEPTDDAAPESPKPDTPARPAAAPAVDAFAAFEATLGGLSLEPLEGDAPPAPPASGRAVFGVSEPAPVEATKPAAFAPAPAPPAASSTNAPDELSLEGFDFEFDENTEIRTDSIVRLGAEPVLDDMSVDLDSELDALLQREAELADPIVAPAVDETPVPARIERVFVLGASIGGPDAVREFLAALPPTVPALFLLAQHMGADFLDLMVQQLTRATKLKVRPVADGDLLSHGEVVIVPTSSRIEVGPDGRAKVGPMPAPSPYSPSIDQVMRDMAETFGTSSGAIIFSGMAHDAIDGARQIVAKGGVVWVQDPASCVISSMVDGAREAGVVSYTARPAELARHFLSEYAT